MFNLAEPWAAFTAFQPLAAALSELALLRRPPEGSKGRRHEVDWWAAMVRDYFPPGRNDPEDGQLLYRQLRSRILKTGDVGDHVGLVHDRPDLHWKRADEGHLCLDLQSLAADYAHAVDRFLEALGDDPALRIAVLPKADTGPRVIELRVAQGAQAFTGTAGTANTVATAWGQPGVTVETCSCCGRLASGPRPVPPKPFVCYACLT